jgi:hypothetical protein
MAISRTKRLRFDRMRRHLELSPARAYVRSEDPTEDRHEGRQAWTELRNARKRQVLAEQAVRP